MIPKTTSIIVATFLVGSIASMTPLIQTSAESYCLVGFNLVTNAEAATVDPEVPEIDANGDGLLCRTDMTSAQGTPQILFTDNAASGGGACPDHFTRTPWPLGIDPDRNGNGFVCIKVVSSGKVVIIDDNKPCNVQCLPSPGTKIAFESSRDGQFEIYKMNSDGGGQTRLTTNAASDTEADWSPDGTKIAFTSLRDGNEEIYVMNSNGSGQTNLSNNAASDVAPSWSPDGTRIAFASNRDGGNFQIYIMNSNGGGQTRLTNNAATDGEPDWSPDGTKIAFTSNRDGDAEIYLMNSDGTGQTNLSNNAAVDNAASWSPDSTKIAFSSDRDGNNEIYVMNSDGKRQTRLTNNAATDDEPSWGTEPNSF